MNAVVAERLYTPEDFLGLGDQRGFELIDGRLKEKSMGMEASEITVNLATLLKIHVKANKLGHVFGSECSYQIFADHPNRVRKPDGSFVARGRFPEDKPFRGHSKVAPDLAFEVVSPNDLAEEVNEKVVEFLGAGVRLLWVVYPASRTIHVFRPKGGAALLLEADQLSGEDVVPGFSCRVADVFSDL
jgi:Uma2 family endonuclease